MVSLGKRGCIYFLVGVEVFLGLLFCIMYELIVEGGLSGSVIFFFYFQVDGGVGIMVGWQVFIGLEGDLQEGWMVQFKVFYGWVDQIYCYYYIGSEVLDVNFYFGNYMNLRLGFVYSLQCGGYFF